MELFEYIKSQLPQMPNTVIMKQLGASQELIDYVKETPENTNLNVMESITNPDEDAKIWYSGTFEPSGGWAGGELSPTDKANTDALIANPDDYVIIFNDTELTRSNGYWFDNTDNPTIQFGFENSAAQFEAEAETNPFIVEVSVKAK